MAVRIDIAATPPVSLTSNTGSSVVINSHSAPASVTNTTVASTVIKVLTGAKGDQNVYVGDAPPDNPQEDWVWIDTNG